MSAEQPTKSATLETAGTPTVYCNQAVFSLSYNDVRVYLLETSPSELVLNPSGNQLAEKPPNIESKFCLVLSPEFARSLAKALSDSVAQYEGVFGALRAEPSQEQISAAVAKK